MEGPIGGPRCFEGCAKGNLALNYSPMSYTTERPSVAYRSVGSGGTDAHMRDGSHYQRLQSAMHILPSFARCTIPHAASTLWRRAFRGTELLRQPPLRHLQAVLAPEQLALEHVGRNA